MKKTIAFVFTLTVISLLSAQSLQTAVTELQNENLISAKRQLLAVYKNQSTSDVSYYLGNCYLRLGAADSAAYYYRLASGSDDAFGHLGKAKTDQLTGKDISAVKEHLDKALSFSRRRDAEVFFQAGYLAYQASPAQALELIPYLEEAIRMAPENKFYPLTLGDIYLNMNEGGKAMSKYEEVLDKDSNYVLTNIRIGRLYYSAKNYETAIRFLEKANSIDPTYSIVHKELGELYYHTRQYEKAAPAYRKYIDLNENDSRAKAAYGAFLFQLKEYQKAIDEVGVFLKTDSNNYIYHRILAYCNYELKKTKDAQASLNKFLATVGNNKVSGLDYSYAGKIAAAGGDTANAIKYFKTSVSIDTANADLQSEYAKALFNARRYTESIEQYKRRMGMSKSPLSLDYYYIGRAYYAVSDYISADTAFADFTRLQPKSPDGYLWRAKCNIEREDKTNFKGYSVPHYLKYIELASSDVARNKSNLINAYTYLAFVSISAKDKEAAKLHLNKILELDPENKTAAEELQKLSK